MTNQHLRHTLALMFTVLLALVARSQGQSESILYSFVGGSDGANPYAGLALDDSGNLYGTTVYGGGTTACNNGCGTAFKTTTSGTETILYRFEGNTDGANPYGGLILDSSGNLYGTTIFGGFYSGTVFELNSEGVETQLHVFMASSGDGALPYQALVRDSDGNLYGTTYSGGTQCTSQGGCGTVFKVTASGTESVLYSFSGGTDGGYPFSTLLRAANGDLYGTTVFGGADDQGTVFKVSPEGVETVLYSFTGAADGGEPEGGLIFDHNGNIVGTTSKGGTTGNGTVFKVTRTGNETVLYSFQGGTDGSVPPAGVIMDKKGRLYGTTYSGGASGLGTVFKLSSGKESILYSFQGGTDGASPSSSLVQDSAGDLYGTTYSGGAAGFGTVFKVVP
jgi:uncharacterized repeat protein (TIGR03803 family)